MNKVCDLWIRLLFVSRRTSTLSWRYNRKSGQTAAAAEETAGHHQDRAIICWSISYWWLKTLIWDRRCLLTAGDAGLFLCFVSVAWPRSVRPIGHISVILPSFYLQHWSDWTLVEKLRLYRRTKRRLLSCCRINQRLVSQSSVSCKFSPVHCCFLTERERSIVWSTSTKMSCTKPEWVSPQTCVARWWVGFFF